MSAYDQKRTLLVISPAHKKVILSNMDYRATPLSLWPRQ
jgi:hypothetical protein